MNDIHAFFILLINYISFTYLYIEGRYEVIQIKKCLDQILKSAIDKYTSDVYILPYDKKYVIKMRIGMDIKQYRVISQSLFNQLINYCKYNSNMAISENRRPQLGSMIFDCNSVKYYLRLSTVGNFRGNESLVIRIIYSLTDSNQSFFDEQQFLTLSNLSKKRGLILLAGPTGSGKTTTIYHLAKQYSDQKMVMSIEDPVEIIEDKFLQLQINQKAGMGYQELLKVGLRHRPDIFIIGEIRDSYTAKMATQAALSGHLVFSTIHARNALGIIDRLLQLGVDRHYLIQALNSVAYQRLIPNKNDYLKALLDIKTRNQIFHELSDEEHLFKNWRDNLSGLVKNNQISKEIYEQFKFG